MSKLNIGLALAGQAAPKTPSQDVTAHTTSKADAVWAKLPSDAKAIQGGKRFVVVEGKLKTLEDHATFIVASETPPQPEVVAKEFAKILRAWLDPEEMKQVNAYASSPEADPSVCMSGDFCDSNMAMDEAFKNISPEFYAAAWADNEATEGEGQLWGAMNDVWNEAWGIAKKANFYVDEGVAASKKDSRPASKIRMSWRAKKVKAGADVDDVRQAEITLEPMTCRKCGGSEVTFNQGVNDAYCAECGEWQSQLPKKVKAGKAGGKPQTEDEAYKPSKRSVKAGKLEALRVSIVPSKAEPGKFDLIDMDSAGDKLETFDSADAAKDYAKAQSWTVKAGKAGGKPQTEDEAYKQLEPGKKWAVVVLNKPGTEGKIYEAKEVSTEKLMKNVAEYALAQWCEDSAEASKMAKILEDCRADKTPLPDSWGTEVSPQAMGKDEIKKHPTETQRINKLRRADVTGSKHVKAYGDALRSVKVTFANGDVINTNMAKGLSDEDIRDYYAIGKQFNLGTGADGYPEDNVQAVTKVEILASKKVKASTDESPDSEDIDGADVRIYDNGGETIDRYTIIVENPVTRAQSWLGSNENPYHPQGYGQHVGDESTGNQEGEHLGKLIKFAELPEPVQKFVRSEAEAMAATPEELASLNGSKKKTEIKATKYTGDIDADFEATLVDVVAETVAEDAILGKPGTEAHNPSAESEPKTKALATHLADRARQIYKNNKTWGTKMAKAEASAAGARDQLYMWMEHWAASWINNGGKTTEDARIEKFGNPAEMQPSSLKAGIRTPGIRRLSGGRWRGYLGNTFATMEEAAEKEAYFNCDMSLDFDSDEYKAQYAAALKEILSNVRASKLKAAEPEADEDGPFIEETVSVKLTWQEAVTLAKRFGYDLEPSFDPGAYDAGYMASDAKNLRLPKKYDGAAELFPDEVAMAAGDAEADAAALEVAKASKDAFTEALESINVVGEYLDANNEQVQKLKNSPAVLSATWDGEGYDAGLDIVIQNPTHLFNDIINGVGYIAPDLEVREPMSPEDVKGYLGHLVDYFEVYGDRKPEISDNLSPDVSDQDLEYHLEYRLRESGDITQERAAEAIIEHMDEEYERPAPEDEAEKESWMDEIKEWAVKVAAWTGLEADAIIKASEAKMNSGNPGTAKDMKEKEAAGQLRLMESRKVGFQKFLAFKLKAKGGASLRRPFLGKSLKTDLKRVSTLDRKGLEELGERVTRQHDRTPRFDRATGVMPRKRIALEELEDKIIQRSDELDAKGSLRAYTPYRKYPDPEEAKTWSDEALADALQQNDPNGSYTQILNDIKSGEMTDISREDNRETLLDYMKKLWESEEAYKRDLKGSAPYESKSMPKGPKFDKSTGFMPREGLYPSGKPVKAVPGNSSSKFPKPNWRKVDGGGI